MFIVVESGSTKADWMIVNGTSQSTHNTMGFNPYFHTKEDILIELNAQLELDVIKDNVQEIFFYGAGCSSPEMNAVIEKALKEFFTNAKIEVNHDLSASAYACYNNKPEIACILGTGSNSCMYDGKIVSEEVPALSYILGDEGSGAYFGKALIADYLYKRLPEVMAKEFELEDLDKDTIFENVYQKPNANVFIASLASILIRHKNMKYSQDLIKKGFQHFIDNHVKCYKNYHNYEVNFVGSIASLLQAELKEVCKENGLVVGCIIRRPLDRLVKYHQKKTGDGYTNHEQ